MLYAITLKRLLNHGDWRCDMSRKRRIKSQSTIDKQDTKTIKDKPMLGRLVLDAFSNPLTRAGYGMPNALEATQYNLTRLTQNYQELNALYRGHWIVQKLINIIPQDMLKNGYEIMSDLNPEQIQTVQSVIRRTQVNTRLRDGLYWGRLYGGAAGIILIKGHADIMSEELDLDEVEKDSFKGLLIVDRWGGVSPSDELVTDLDSPDLGYPKYYDVALNNGGEIIRVHHTRVCRFIGREMPYLERLAEQYWGTSELEHVMDELRKRDNVSWNIALLSFMANIRVMKLDGMEQILAMGNDKAQKALYNTIEGMNMLLNNNALQVLGKEDDYQQHSYAFSGVGDVYDRFMMDVSGACGIPATKLFGRSPAGMNSTGESDMQNYYDTIETNQEAQLRPVLDKLLPIICASALGAVPDDLDYAFNPVRRSNDDEKQDLGSKQTTAVVQAFTAGLISQKTALKELQQSSKRTAMWSNITDEDIEKADDDTTAEGEGMLPGMPPMGNSQGKNDVPSLDSDDEPIETTDADWHEDDHPRDEKGRFSSKGGKSRQSIPKSIASNDNKIGEKYKEVQPLYDEVCKREKAITNDLVDIAGELDCEMYGLEFRLKTASSVTNKMECFQVKYPNLNDSERFAKMNDIIRYTQLGNHDDLVDITNRTVENLRDKGYNVIEIDNKYLDGGDYKGIHIGVLTKDGQAFELQIHSKESMDVKNKLHPMYEEARNVNTAEERVLELKRKMNELSKSLPSPKNIELLKTWKDG